MSTQTGRACPSVRLLTLAAPTCGTRKGTRGTHEYSRVLTSAKRHTRGTHEYVSRLLSVEMTTVPVGQCYTAVWEWPQVGVGLSGNRRYKKWAQVGIGLYHDGGDLHVICQREAHGLALIVDDNLRKVLTGVLTGE